MPRPRSTGALDRKSVVSSDLRLGLVPDAGITFHLARRIGVGRSLSSLMLAERIDAKTALDWGLRSEERRVFRSPSGSGAGCGDYFSPGAPHRCGPLAILLDARGTNRCQDRARLGP